jgi:hypothetical protein
MKRACRELRERLAAGERVPLVHLERCAACAAFARDLEWLKREAAALPRPPFPEGPRRRVEPSPVARRALVALASALSLALALGLALRDRGGMPPAGVRDAGVRRGSAEPPLDLLGSLSEAQRVYAPVSTGNGGGWLALPGANGSRLYGRDGESNEVIDPLASLRPATLLIEDVTKPRR